MNSLKNNVRLIGNLGNDPEIINLESGKKLAKFSLATNESFTNKSGEKETETQWHNCIVWGKGADLVEKLLKKGSEIALDGKIIYNKYETKEGEKRTNTEIQVNEFLLLDSK